jgi:CheY-like chemotaxis protein
VCATGRARERRSPCEHGRRRWPRQAILRLEAIEFVLTDQEMPGVDGVEFCRWVRAQPAHHDLPVVMLSAASEPVGLVPCWTGFLRKPVSFQQLSAAIDAHVAPRLTAAQCVVPKTSMRASLKCQHPPASRWVPLAGECEPDL